MKIKAVVLGTFTIKIESVECKELMEYFPMLQRKWWGNNKKGDQHPQQWKKREVRKKEKESEEGGCEVLSWSTPMVDEAGDSIGGWVHAPLYHGREAEKSGSAVSRS
jgi:hypothetical protein